MKSRETWTVLHVVTQLHHPIPQKKVVSCYLSCRDESNPFATWSMASFACKLTHFRDSHFHAWLSSWVRFRINFFPCFTLLTKTDLEDSPRRRVKPLLPPKIAQRSLNVFIYVLGQIIRRRSIGCLSIVPLLGSNSSFSTLRPWKISVRLSQTWMKFGWEWQVASLFHFPSWRTNWAKRW